MALPFTRMALALAVAAVTLVTGASLGFIIVTVLVLLAGVGIFKDSPADLSPRPGGPQARSYSAHLPPAGRRLRW